MSNKKNKKKVNPVPEPRRRASPDGIEDPRQSRDTLRGGQTRYGAGSEPKFASQTRYGVKVIYDRQNCIGAGSCAVVAPQFWKMKNDNKASLINATINKKTGNYELELEVDEEELALLKDSQDACPVRVIKVIKQ